MVTTALLDLAGCANQGGSVNLEGKPLSGHVRMTQVQAAYIGSGNAGSGVLEYQGSSYPFTVGGLGIGGIGVSKIEARGEVYGLKRLRDFPGAYAQARYGIALGNTSTGDLWLQNGNGVVMRLVAKRQGLMLSLGGDAELAKIIQVLRDTGFLLHAAENRKRNADKNGDDRDDHEQFDQGESA